MAHGKAAEPPVNHPRPPQDNEIFHTTLVVDIGGANLKMQTVNDYRRHYAAFGFVDGPETHIQTDFQRGPNPNWLQKFRVRLGSCEAYKYLHLEVFTLGMGMNDPGTSRAYKVVGRTRIPVPKIGKKTMGRYALERMDENGRLCSEPGGHIFVTVQSVLIGKLRKRSYDATYSS